MATPPQDPPITNEEVDGFENYLETPNGDIRFSMGISPTKRELELLALVQERRTQYGWPIDTRTQ